MRRRRVRTLRRRFRPAIVGLGATLVALSVAGGGHRLGPLVQTGGGSPTRVAGTSITGLVDLFEPVHHEVALELDPLELEGLVDEYVATRAKPYLSASVTIDGTRLDRVGVRLKGNSTLDIAVFGSTDDTEDSTPPPPPLPGIAQRPADLPLLLRFDRFVAEQRYQGMDELALRLPFRGQPVGLNEAVALDLVGAAGLPTQRSAFADVTVNGGPAHLRLLVEVPSTAWAEREVGGGGTLYRATGNATFDDVDDDLASYAAMYEQISHRGRLDARPVADLVRWVNRADDTAFERDLHRHVDVDALARYLAVHAALLNADDLGGGGRNYYLWFDDRTGRATVLTWDLNLALYGGLVREERRLEWEARPTTAGVIGPDGVLTFELDPLEVGPPSSNHPLEFRFLRTPAFQAQVEAELQRACDLFFRGGALRASLQQRLASLSSSSAVSRADLDRELDFFDRTTQLAASNCGDPHLRGYLGP